MRLYLLFFVLIAQNAQAIKCNDLLRSESKVVQSFLSPEHYAENIIFEDALGSGLKRVEHSIEESKNKFTEIEKKQIENSLLLQKKILSNIHDIYEKFAQKDIERQDQAYSFLELTAREIPFYSKEFDALEVKNGLNFRKYRKEDYNILNMSQLSLKRIGKNLRPKTKGFVTVDSNLTPRQRVLNPSDYRESFQIATVEVDSVRDGLLASVNAGYDKKPSTVKEFQKALDLSFSSFVSVDDVPLMSLAFDEFKSSESNDNGFFETVQGLKALYDSQGLEIYLGKQGNVTSVFTPLFIPKKFDKLSEEQFFKLNNEITAFEAAIGKDPKYRLDYNSNAKVLSELVRSQYLLGLRGDDGDMPSLVHFALHGVVDNTYFDKDEHYSKYFNSKGLFNYFSLLRAHFLSKMNGKERINAFDDILKTSGVESWFETLYLYSNANINQSNKLKGRKEKQERKKTGLDIQVGNKAIVSTFEWTSSKSLRTHFKKHGRDEMGLSNKEEYFEASKEFFEEPGKSQVLVKRLNSDTYIKYDFETKEFGVITSEGVVITYYILDEKYRSIDEHHEYLGSDIISR